MNIIHHTFYFWLCDAQVVAEMIMYKEINMGLNDLL